jgi:hypothetical protein
LRFKQCGLRLIQLQCCVDASAFSLLFLAERFLCLGARFEELRAQTLDEILGVVEHLTPVVELPRYNSAAAEKKVVFVVAVPASNAADKASLSLPQPNSSLQFSMPQQTLAGTP